MKGLVLGFLVILFAFALCLTHPIFVFTTACSLTVTFCKLSYALIRRFFSSSKNSNELDLPNLPSLPEGLDFTSYFRGLETKKSPPPEDTFVAAAPITIEQ